MGLAALGLLFSAMTLLVADGLCAGDRAHGRRAAPAAHPPHARRHHGRDPDRAGRKARRRRALVRADVAGANDLLPARELAADQIGVAVRAQGAGPNADLRERLPDLRRSARPPRSPSPSAWRSRAECRPASRSRTSWSPRRPGNPASRKVGTSGREGDLSSSLTAKRPHAPRIEVADRRRQALHQRHDLAAHQIVHRRRRAAIGDVGQRHTGRAREQLADEMVHRAVAAGAVGDLAGPCARQLDQLLDARDRSSRR